MIEFEYYEDDLTFRVEVYGKTLGSTGGFFEPPSDDEYDYQVFLVNEDGSETYTVNYDEDDVLDMIDHYWNMKEEDDYLARHGL